MKKALFVIIVMLSSSSFSQWSNKTVKNGFDEPFKVSTTSMNNNCYLKLENIGAIDEERYVSDSTIVDGMVKYIYSWRKVYGLSLDLCGSYFCKDNPRVDIVLVVSGQDKKYTLTGSVHSNRKGVEIYRNINSDLDFVSDFKKATAISVRICDTECETETFHYKMTGSSSALQFITRNE